MNDMNDMRNNREDYRNYRDDYRGSNNRYYDDAFYGNYRDDYREDYRRNYDRRGGRMNNRDYRDYRNYRNYREDYYEELEMAMEDMHEGHRKLEDISEMATNPQEKNIIMKVAQKEKENYMALKQMIEKQM